MENIQKNLNNFLETKCKFFPRFYFLSDEELLEILAQSIDPQAVQPHLKKCFDNIYRLFSNETDASNIIGMESGEKERVEFLLTIKAKGNVEKWLYDV